jgi:nucleotide-binding universal stress UspA family protein
MAMAMPKLPKKILCPVDLSDLSIGPLRYSGVLAKDLEAELHILHAHKWAAPLEFVPGEEQYFMAEIKIWEASTGKIIEDFANQYVGDVPFQASVVENGIVEAIVEKSKEIEADLIVMGTHGRSGMGRLVSGSVAEEVIRSEDRPVLVIRMGLKPPGYPQPLFSKILCPVNFTDVASDALLYALSISARYSAHLTVIYSIEHDMETEDSAREKLETWISDVTDQQCSCRIVTESGHASEQIIRFARSSESDLIVIGAQKRPFLETILFGTTTERVMRHAPCPVLVLSSKF